MVDPLTQKILDQLIKKLGKDLPPPPPPGSPAARLREIHREWDHQTSHRNIVIKKDTSKFIDEDVAWLIAVLEYLKRHRAHDCWLASFFNTPTDYIFDLERKC